jgi:protein-L-isoaspartate(D-aspartate) O-methyltransferase
MSSRKQECQLMVEQQLMGRDIEDNRVLEAFLEVPRHEFVPEEQQDSAYEDRPLPIGKDQTISQPYIVAEMIQALKPEAGDRVLEVGTGSGYATAILSRIVAEVYSVERFEELARKAENRFQSLGYDNIEVHVGDGTKGWSEKSLYDGILVSAAAPGVPAPLEKQLASGGRIVVPVGEKGMQKLFRIENKEGKLEKSNLGMVRFVPLIGEEGWKF